MKKRIFSLLTAVLMISCLCGTVCAQEVPDLTRNGSLTITMSLNGAPLDSGSLTVCKIGDIVETNGNYSFQPVSQLTAYDISLENLEDPSLASLLTELAAEEDLPAISREITEGAAFFEELAPGLYVVMQEAAAKGFAPINPFLISVPNFQDGVYQYEVTADPKVPPEPAPEETTKPTQPEPTDPELPNTGQLNWPVPVLAVSGLALFLVGWYLRKERHEA